MKSCSIKMNIKHLNICASQTVFDLSRPVVGSYNRRTTLCCFSHSALVIGAITRRPELTIDDDPTETSATIFTDSVEDSNVLDIILVQHTIQCTWNVHSVGSGYQMNQPRPPRKGVIWYKQMPIRGLHCIKDCTVFIHVLRYPTTYMGVDNWLAGK